MLDGKNYRESENNFLDSWAEHNPGFIRDGVADPDEYFSARFKILFLLKEANGGNDWDMRDYLCGDTYPYSMNNIARWTEGILNFEQDIPSDELEDSSKSKQRRKTMLRKIALVNIKKISGGAMADDDKILQAAKDNSSLLKQQLNLCNPDIVICGGASPYYIDYIANEKSLLWKKTTRGIRYLLDGKRIVIDYYHPQTRMPVIFLHYALVDAVREILGEI